MSRIDVEVARGQNGALKLTYRLSGAIEAIAVPPPAAPERTDGLWQHTCFEAFVQAKDGYYEFNFSPSTQWAAYRFSSYREGMAPADIKAPLIEWRSGELRISLELPQNVIGPLGLSAVIEGIDGSKSYWALRHPLGKPDFHHGDCFALNLPPAD